MMPTKIFHPFEYLKTSSFMSLFSGGTKNTKNQIEISDKIISTPEEVSNSKSEANVESSQTTDSNVRRRNKNKVPKDNDRTSSTANSSSENHQNAMQASSNNSVDNIVKPVQKKVSQVVLKEKQVNGTASADVKKGTKEGTVDVSEWSQNQQAVLEWALKQCPKGTDQRWEKISEHVPGKTKVGIGLGLTKVGIGLGLTKVGIGLGLTKVGIGLDF